MRSALSRVLPPIAITTAGVVALAAALPAASPGPLAEAPQEAIVAPPGPAPSAAPPASGYVDDATCARCHTDLARSFRDVGMAKSFFRPSRQRAIEDFDTVFEHATSGRSYQMTWRGERLVFLRWQTTVEGRSIHLVEQPVDWVLGSGHTSRTYLYANPAGELYQLPLAWYSQDGGHWAMAPGFDRVDHQGLLRAVRRECMFCHNAYPDVPAGSDRDGAPHVFPSDLPEGIGCQRCHGPGGEHVHRAEAGTFPMAAVRDAIVDPGGLPAVLRDDVCWQCHMQPSVAIAGVRPLGVADYAFRPGQPLPDALLHYEVVETQRSRGDRFEINHHPYRLRQSACWQESARSLTCTTCHDPHRKVPAAERAAHYRSACLGCHGEAPGEGGGAVESAALAGLHREAEVASTADCASCHMPRRRTQDVVHVVMTDHRIGRRPEPAAARLAALPETEPIVEDLFPLEPERAPTGDLGELYRALAVVRMAGTASPPAIERLGTLLPRVLREGAAEIVGPGLDLALAQFGSGRLVEAEETLGRILAVAPDHVRAVELLGLLRSRQGRADEALALLERAAGGGAPRPEALYNLARMLEAAGREDEAEAVLERAVVLRPTFAYAWYRLGLLRERRGELPRAVIAQRRALAIEPSLPEPYPVLARTLVALDAPAEALVLLRHGELHARSPGVVAAAREALEAELAATGPRPLRPGSGPPQSP